MIIRPASAADLPAIDAIYNHYVRTSTCTYQEIPSTETDRRAWFDLHGPEHPITVAIVEDQIVGWGAISRFHPRSAYRRTVENAVYVRHDQHRRGIGRALLNDLIDRARALGHHTIIALIDAEQRGSIALHRNAGFTQAGQLNELGNKFDRWLDVSFMQLMLRTIFRGSIRSSRSLRAGRRSFPPFLRSQPMTCPY